MLLTRPGYEERASAAGSLQVGRRKEGLVAHAGLFSVLPSGQCCCCVLWQQDDPGAPLPCRRPAAQELLRALPPDLFRTCLARVLMVFFDILVSHFHMVC